jgi:hypothetical protein
MLLSILKDCLLIESTNQLLPLILFPNSKYRISLDNLDFKRVSRDFYFLFLYPYQFFTNLKSSLGEAWRVFFSNLCFGYDWNAFFTLWNSLHEVSLFLLKFLLCKVRWNCLSYLLFWLMFWRCYKVVYCYLLVFWKKKW